MTRLDAGNQSEGAPRGKSLELHCTELAACPLCKSGKSAPIGDTPDTLARQISMSAAVGGTWNARNNLQQCLDCKVAYLSPRLDEPSLIRLYAAWYGSPYLQTQGALSGETQRHTEFARYHLRYINKFASPPARLLDVGTGTGMFVRVAADAGYDAIGVEWSAEAVTIAQEQHRVTVRMGKIADVIGIDERFDVITMFDYLEHTTTPAEDLDCAIARLAPGGILAIRVPNSRSWQSLVRKLNWVGIISFHLTYFDKKSLVKNFSARNMDVLFVNAGNYQTFLELILRKFDWVRNRLRSISNERQQPSVLVSNAQPSTFRSRVLPFVKSSGLEVLDHVGGWAGYGNNTFAIARKRY